MLYAALAGVAARLLLAWSGIGQSLAWRIEVSTAANSNLELREGLALYSLGISPYSGSSCRTPPLALWFYGSLADHDLLHVLPNAILDVLAALLLHRLASSLLTASTPSGSAAGRSSLPAAMAWAYLLNPFTLAASAAGTTSSLEGLAVVTALYGSCARRPALAAFGLAVASYMSLHDLVLLLPAACLLAYGPEDVATPLELLGPAPGACHGDDRGGAKSGSAQLGQEMQQKERQQQAEAGRQQQQPESEGQREDGKEGTVAEEGLQPAPVSPTAAPAEADAAGNPSVPVPGPASGGAGVPPAAVLPLLPWGVLTRCSALLAGWLLLLVLLSDLYLLPLPPQLRFPGAPAAATLCLTTAAELLTCRPPWPPVSSLLAPLLRNPPAAAANGAALAPRLAAAAGAVAGEMRRRLCTVGESLGSCWAARVYGSQVLLDDATPNAGQWWYLAMEVFDDSKVYVRLLAHSLLAALAAPLAMRLGARRPLALFLIQLLCLVLIKPYPSIADLGLAASLLPLLARQQLAALQLRLLLPASLALLCVLGPAMLRMWLSYESANSNFFYSITLLYGVWQVALLGLLLGLTLRLDRVARGKERLEEPGAIGKGDHGGGVQK